MKIFRNNTTAFEDTSIAKLEGIKEDIETVIKAVIRLDGELTDARKENEGLNERIRDLESQLEDIIQTARERSELEP